MLDAYTQLERLWHDRRRTREIVAGDYKSFSDPDLADLARELHAVASPFRERVLTVLRESADGDAHARAAMLIHFARE